MVTDDNDRQTDRGTSTPGEASLRDGLITNNIYNNTKSAFVPLKEKSGAIHSFLGH